MLLVTYYQLLLILIFKFDTNFYMIYQLWNNTNFLNNSNFW